MRVYISLVFCFVDVLPPINIIHTLDAELAGCEVKKGLHAWRRVQSSLHIVSFASFQQCGFILSVSPY